MPLPPRSGPGAQLGLDFARELHNRGIPPRTPPSTPPLRPPAPPTRPPAPPSGPGAGAAARLGAFMLGLDIGNRASEMATNFFFGQPPNLVDQAEEERGMRLYDPPPANDNGGQASGIPPDRQLQPPGRSYGPGRYSSRWRFQYANGLEEEYEAGIHYGPLGDFFISENRLAVKLNEHDYRGNPVLSTIRSTSPGYEFINATLLGIRNIDTGEEGPPPNNQQEEYSYPRHDFHFDGPLGTAPPPSLFPPQAPPTTAPNEDDRERRSPPPTTPPTGAPTNTPNDQRRSGPNNNLFPGMRFNPGGQGGLGSSPTPFPGSLTTPSFNPTPGTSPGTSPGTDPFEGFPLPPLFPGLVPSTPGSPTNTRQQLAPPLFRPGDNPITTPTTQPVPQSPAPSTNTGPDQCHQFNRCSQSSFQSINNRFDGLLQGLDLASNAAMMAMLNRIDGKLGPQLPGGLSSWLTDKFQKLWNSKVVDRALNLLNLAASIHNAVMLSRNIGGTLASALTNVLALIGIKDPEGNVHGIEQAIGHAVEGVIKGIVGEENYTALTTTWKKANRIYQAAVNTWQLMTDSLFSIKEGLETSAKYTGKIGNALKKSGAVLENSYDWMSEKFNFSAGKHRTIQRVLDGLQTAQEVAEDLENITGEFRSAAENINQIGQEINVIKGELNAEETTKKTTEDTKKTASQSPTINPSDLVRPEPPI